MEPLVVQRRAAPNEEGIAMAAFDKATRDNIAAYEAHRGEQMPAELRATKWRLDHGLHVDMKHINQLEAWDAITIDMIGWYKQDRRRLRSQIIRNRNRARERYAVAHLALPADAKNAVLSYLQQPEPGDKRFR